MEPNLEPNFETLKDNQTRLEAAREAEKAQFDAYIEQQKVLLEEQKQLVKDGGTLEERKALAVRQESLITNIEGMFTPEVVEPPLDPEGRPRRR